MTSIVFWKGWGFVAFVVATGVLGLSIDSRLRPPSEIVISDGDFQTKIRPGDLTLTGPAGEMVMSAHQGQTWSTRKFNSDDASLSVVYLLSGRAFSQRPENVGSPCGRITLFDETSIGVETLGRCVNDD